jgi:hypothetical protein
VNTQIFTDVAADRWSAGYIAYCANVGILAGTGDGSFNPEGELTGVAFAKMLLVCLGYDAKIEGYQDNASWATNIAVDAIDAGIDAGLTLAAPLSREDAAQMAFLTLQAPLVEYNNKGADITVNGVPVSFGASQAQYVTTTLAKTQTISKQKLSNSNDYTIEFAEKYFPALVLKDSVTDAFQRPAHTWSYNGSEFGVYYLDDTTLEYTNYVNYGKLYTDLGTNVAAANIELYVDGKADTVSAVTRGSTTQVGASGNGVLTEVYETIDNDGTVSLKIIQVNTYVAKVNAVTAATSSADRTITLAPYTKAPATLNAKFATEEFAAGDLVSYTAAWNSATSQYDIVAVAALEVSDTGLLTAWNGTSLVATNKGASAANFTVNGTTYKYSQKSIVLDDTGDEGAVWGYTVNKSNLNVYLDNYGYALFVTGVEAEKNYAVVIGVGGTNAYGSSTTGVTLLLADGTQVEVTATVNTGSTLTANNLVSEKIGDLVTYTVNDKGVYALTVVDNWDGANYGDATNIAFTNGKSAFTLTSNSTGYNHNYYTTSATVFFVATKSGSSISYNVYTGYSAMPSVDTAVAGMGIAYATNSRYTNQIDYVYLYADHLSGVTGVNTYFVKQANATITTDSTGAYYVLPAIVNGQETNVKVKASLIADNTKAGLWAITNVIEDRNGIITNFSDKTSDATNTFNVNTSATLDNYTSSVVGTVAARNGVLGVGANGNVANAAYWAYTDSTKVYVVDKDYKTISVSSIDAVTTDNNDLVYASVNTANKVLNNVIIVTVPASVSGGTTGTTGGGTYYTVNGSNVYSTGYANLSLTVNRPAWLATGNDLNYSFDIYVNGVKYAGVQTTSDSDGAVDDAARTATYNWNNNSTFAFAPISQDATITVENFKFTNLSAQTYNVKYYDAANNNAELDVTDTTIFASGTSKTVAAGGSAQITIKPGSKYTSNTDTFAWSVEGVTGTTLSGTTAANAGSGAQTGSDLTVVTNREDYVKVTVDFSNLTPVAVKYSVTKNASLNTDFAGAVELSGSGGNAVAMEKFGLTGFTTDTLIIKAGTASTFSSADVTGSTLSQYDVVYFQATVGSATDALSYDVTIKTSAGDVKIDNVDSSAAKTGYLSMPAANVTVDDVVVTVHTPKLIVSSVAKVANNQIAITFNTKVDESSATTLTNYAYTPVSSHSGKTIVGATLDSTGTVVTLTVDTSLAAGDTIATTTNIKHDSFSSDAVTAVTYKLNTAETAFEKQT